MRISLLLSTLVWTLGLAVTSHAAAFTIGVESTEYSPIYKGDTGNYSGYARELLDAFAAKAGHQFTYKPMPISRLFDEFAKQKSLDFKFPDNPQWQQDVKKGVNITYSSSAVTVTEGLLVLPANKGKPLTNIHTIGTLRGFTAWPYMDQIKAKTISVVEANAADAALLMGINGRVDAVFLNTISANYTLAEKLKQPKALVFDDKLPSEKSDFSLSTIAHPEVVKAFNDFLAKEKDTVSKLKAKYNIIE
jgi:ABC-type amino acid transport substrate-binding protein